jgi:uncharacterized membrane protein YheB (UPF0754 family)
MNEIFLIVVMVLVGAVIGGFTNALAIRMLFRPYHAKYIGRWKLPFTPGLIPKRREQLATQLGNMVVNHLLTEEAIAKKIQDPSFKKQVVQWAQMEASTFLYNGNTLREYLHKLNIPSEQLEEQIETKVIQYIKTTYERKMSTLSSHTINECINPYWQNKVDEFIPTGAKYISESLISYFNSEQGKEKLSKTIDEFLTGKGMLGSMVSMFLGNERLVDKVLPEIIKFLEDPANNELIEMIVDREWQKVKKLKISTIQQFIESDKILEQIQQFIVSELNAHNLLDRPIKSVLSDEQKESIINESIPKMMTMLLKATSKRLASGLEKLNLEQIVKEQVQSFSVARLEEMVLDISRRELKMITYLGALLGGLIGLLQGVLLSLLT